jgi:hypothetical protein
MAGNEDTAISNKQLAHGKPGSATVSHGKKTNRKSKTQTHKPSRITTPAREHPAARDPRTKARRRMRRSDADERVTTFPEVKGKVVREVRFTHDDPENVLAIAFKDRTVLYFEVDPEPLVLPVDIRAHYIGERRSAAKSWEGLGR